MTALDELAERAQTGDREALEGVVRGLQDRIYRLSLRFLGHPDFARDATQEILIVIVTQLSTFRRQSSVSTWAYRVATRHLLRERRRFRELTFESLASEDLGKPPNAIEPDTLASAEERLLEEEIFVGCTHAMLQALDKDQRIAFVLGAICELESAEAAFILEISEAAFRKRLSRARAALDAFVAGHCGVANSATPCRCRFQVNHAVSRGRLDPAHLKYGRPVAQTSLEALRAMGEIHEVRRSLELYRAQPAFELSHDFAKHLREIIASATALS